MEHRAGFELTIDTSYLICRSLLWKFTVTSVWCRYNSQFSPNSRKGQSLNHPWERGMHYAVLFDSSNSDLCSVSVTAMHILSQCLSQCLSQYSQSMPQSMSQSMPRSMSQSIFSVNASVNILSQCLRQYSQSMPQSMSQSIFSVNASVNVSVNAMHIRPCYNTWQHPTVFWRIIILLYETPMHEIFVFKHCVLYTLVKIYFLKTIPGKCSTYWNGD